MGRTRYFVLEDAVFSDFVSANAVEEFFGKLIRISLSSRSDRGFLDSP